MNKSYGFRGQIIPESVGSQLNEIHTIDGIEICIKNGVLEVGYNDINQEQKARNIANNLINSWRIRNNIKITVDFNQTWKPNIHGGKDININLSDTIHATDRVIVSSIVKKGLTYVVKQLGDSYSFSEDIELTKKALQDKPLMEALNFFGEEVIDNDKPLYGIYKAIEVITDHLPGDGRAALSLLVGKNRKYVSDVMETANFSRHGNPQGRNLLSENECRDRARILITAYANSL